MSNVGSFYVGNVYHDGEWGGNFININIEWCELVLDWILRKKLDQRKRCSKAFKITNKDCDMLLLKELAIFVKKLKMCYFIILKVERRSKLNLFLLAQIFSFKV